MRPPSVPPWTGGRGREQMGLSAFQGGQGHDTNACTPRYSVLGVRKPRLRLVVGSRASVGQDRRSMASAVQKDHPPLLSPRERGEVPPVVPPRAGGQDSLPVHGEGRGGGFSPPPLGGGAGGGVSRFSRFSRSCLLPFSPRTSRSPRRSPCNPFLKCVPFNS